MSQKFRQTMQSLPQSVQRLVHEAVKDLSPKKIILFGSRARGSHKESSDFDLCVVDAKFDEMARARFLVKMEEEPITLYKVDLVFFEKLNAEYQKNITLEGKLLYGN